jgi:hypothetical protein
MPNDITLPEAKFSHALDEYYGFLHAIVSNSGGTVGDNQRLVTLNTITPYSIVKDKPLYNMFVLRAYADLVIRRSSSADAGSPKAPPSDIIESANSGDAWSWEYFRIAFPNLLQELKKYVQDPAVVAKISALESTWGGAYDHYRDELNKIELEWAAYAKANGLDADANPTKYYREKAHFFRLRKDKVQRLYDKQFSILIEISDLELAHLDANGLLLKDLKDNLSSVNQVRLPIRPELEDYVASDPTNSPGDYDRRPAVYPAGTNVFNELLDQTNDGTKEDQFQRGYEIKRQKITQYTHDTDWAASGSARKFMFLKANLSVAEKTHFEEQINLLGQIRVGFRAIQEVVIIRGRWYSGAFLKSAAFQKWLDAQPEFREKLRHLITSVIVCRGLTLQLNFVNDIHQASWRDLKIKGSGGLSVGGWNFGMSGHYNSHTTWDLTDVTNNSVTFADGPNVCRIIGLKVENVLDDLTADSLTAKDDYARPVSRELIEKYTSGDMDYSEFLSEVQGHEDL